MQDRHLHIPSHHTARAQLAPGIKYFHSFGFFAFNRLLSLCFMGLLALLGSFDYAYAQAAACRQLEAQLAAVPRGESAPRNSNGAMINRQRAEIGRVQRQMQAYGCNQARGLFGPPLPQQCYALANQLSGLQAGLSQLSYAAPPSSGNAERRARILASIEAYGCRNQPERPQVVERERAPARVATQQPAPPPQPVARQPRSLLEALFGVREVEPTQQIEDVRQEIKAPKRESDGEERSEKKNYGGSLAVCVRTCDGYFFPVNFEGSTSNDTHDEICHAQCPATETAVFYTRAGADIDVAVNAEGKPYTALPNAMRYRRSFDPSCSCRAQGQGWAETLNGADAHLTERGSDIVVSEQRSEASAKPKEAPATKQSRNKKGKLVPEVSMTAASPVITDPKNISKPEQGGYPATLAQSQGETRETIGSDGVKRNVRVVVPSLSPIP